MDIEIIDIVEPKKPKKKKKLTRAEGLKKRAPAYIIDMIIILLILFLINYFLPESNNVANLNKELNDITTNMLAGNTNFGTYIVDFSNVIHGLDKERVLINVINAVLIVVYFILIPYLRNGKTIGLKLMGLKIVRFDKELLALHDLVIRNIIVNGLGYLLICLAAIYILSPNIYFPFISILGIIQIFILITSLFMIIYRRDNFGLQDLISKTKVIKDSEV